MHLSGITHFILLNFVTLTSGFNVDVHDANIITGFGSSGSYFGYSVALASTDTEKWILVGAPRSDDPLLPNVNRPGAVYRCNIVKRGSTNCSLLDIDHNTASQIVLFGGKAESFKNGRNDSWLGGSIAVGPRSSAGFVTCAPKWYNDRIDTHKAFEMNGMCYKIPLDFNMNNVKKMPVYIDKSGNKVGGVGVWDYGFSGLGMSVRYTEGAVNGMEHILIGSPGLLDWIGGFVDIYGNTVKRMEHRITTTAITRPYIGSALSSGKYFSDGITYIATGAPREDMTGSVAFFRLNESKFVYQAASLILTGRDVENKDLPVNAYFGATLCTVDINKDGADDLLVGAPLYASLTNGVFNEYTDLGLVSVHIGSRQLNQFKHPSQILTGVEPYGRFGTAIGSLGDINADSFPDVAIGAPYENNNKGAVYIFNGYTKGLWPAYSQRIQASELNTGLSGFGISISSGMDLNSDKVNDVAIGSYLSDEVVLLFGQPVITLHGELKIQDENNVETEFVEINERNKFVEVCVRFSDRACDYVDLNVTTKLDLKQDQPRVKFAANAFRVITNALRVRNDNACTPKNRIIAVPTFDYNNAIVVRVEYSVQAIECSSYDVAPTVNRFDGNNPLDPKVTIQKQLRFRKDCPNNICNSNLTLVAEAVYENEDGKFLIGKQALRLDIDIKKTGDPSYGSMFHMIYPSFLEFTKMDKVFGDSDVACSLLEKRNETDNRNISIGDGESGLECSLGNPMRNDTGVDFKLHMRVPSNVTESSIKLNMAVKTSNTEQNPSDNTREIVIDLKYDLKASFSGSAAPDEVYVDVDLKDSYDMKHIYELTNGGPSTVIEAHLNISYPVYLVDGRSLLYLNATETNCDGTCKIGCTVQNAYTSPPVHQYTNGRLLSVSEKQSGELATVKKPTCTTKECPMLLCTANNIQAQTSAVIYLKFVIKKDIKTVLGNGKTEKFVTHATVQINEPDLNNTRTRFEHQLTTMVKVHTLKAKNLGAKWWIILVSGLGGLLLILIMILILWKVGFFKRKKRDQVRDMRKSRAISSMDAGTTDNPPQKTKKDSYSDSEGGIIDGEVLPSQS